jgi:hypothetical protein
MKGIQGVYTISFKNTKYYYYGSSNNIFKRWENHLWCLNNNKHGNAYLQNIYNKYKDNILLSIVNLTDNYLEKEQEYLNNFYKKDGCLNLSPKVNYVERAKTVILQYSLDGNFIKEWESIKEAHNVLNINFHSICKVAFDSKHQLGGFLWRYKTYKYPLTIEPYKKSLNNKSIISFDANLNVVKKYKSLDEACKEFNLDKASLSVAIKKNYYFANLLWLFEKDYNKGKKPNIPKRKHEKKEVNCYDEFGNFIKSYESMHFASLNTNIPMKTISSHCINKVKKHKCNKYKIFFRYKNEKY